MADLIAIDTIGDVVRVATLRGGRLDDLVLALRDEAAAPGDIFMARVRRLPGGLDGAFVDLGAGGDGFLRGIAGLGLTEGQRLPVQVTRAAGGGKGPVVTAALAFAGRYVVLHPDGSGLDLSPRLGDAARARLEAALASPAGGGGFTIRTAAGGVDTEAVVAERDRLAAAWAAIAAALESAAPGTRVHRPPAMPWPALRDLAAVPGGGIVVAGDAEATAAARLAGRDWPDLAGALEVRAVPGDLFAETGIADELAALGEVEVALPSGGRLVIEETRALTAIDVDSGAARAGNPARLALETNLEAAAEAARQLRLRNVGGLGVVDFVHSRRRPDRARVVAALRAAVARDRAEVQVLDMSPLGLVEFTRARLGPSLAEVMDRAAHAGESGA